MRDSNLNNGYQTHQNTNAGSNSAIDANVLTVYQAEILLRSVDDLVFVLDAERNFVKCFQPESSNLMMPVTQFLNKNLSILPLSPQVMELIQKAFDAAAASGIAQTIDYCLPVNGQIKWFNSKISTLVSINGLNGFIVVARDVTEWKENVQQLEANEKKYHLLADHILDLIGLHDVNGIFEYVSPSSLTVLGYAPEELIGRNAFDLIHPEESAGILEDRRNKTSEGRDTFIDEFRIMHKARHYIHLETTTKIIRDTDLNPVKFLSTSRDITEWKQAQFALMESEEKYRSLVENSDNIIGMIDKNNRYLFVNSQTAAFYGRKAEDIIGKHVGEILNTGKEQLFIENIQKVISEERVIRSEDSLLIGDRQYWIRASIHPIRNAQGKVDAVLFNAIDITNLKRTESLLAEQNKGLREIAFLQSHVLRAPLSNIKYLISLFDAASLSDENKILFDLLHVSADNLDDAIKQIVDKTYLPEA